MADEDDPRSPVPTTDPEAPEELVRLHTPEARTAARAARRAQMARRRRVARLRGAALLVGVLAMLAGGLLLWRDRSGGSLHATGPRPGAVLGPALLPRLAFTTRGHDAGAQRWQLDGRRVAPRPDGHGLLVYRPPRLADGAHTLRIRREGGPLGGGASQVFRFRVDTKPPVVRLDHPAVTDGVSPVRVSGTIERGSRLTASGRPVPVRNGRFALRYAAAPPRVVVLAATDPAGNAARLRMPISLVARRPLAPLRAVHVTAYGWADKGLRQGILALIAQHRVNAIELDIKDEAGLVGWPTAVPLARQVKARQDIFDLRAAVRRLHGLGVRVIGRIVCFRDPLLAAAAWRAGRRQQVVQTPSGAPYAGYGGFSNPADPVVRAYNIALAVDAARAGVDDILYDYVRRPDGPLSSMVFPGLRGSPEQTIVTFLTETRRALRPYGTFLGASVFGVAATRPSEVAQDIPKMAREVDYIAPMVYPSHWGAGEYGVADPNGEPYAIVRRSLADFARDIRGTGARIVPWLQDFSLGRTYGPAEVRAQIAAAHANGMDDFILWDPAVTYTAAALTPNASRRAVRTAPLRPPPGTRALLPLLAVPRPVTRVRGRRSPARRLPPNELGQVPVLMHHEIRPDRVGPFDQTPAEFRAELQRLWRDGFVPVRASDLVTGKLDVPDGRSPVVLTFDDATRYQFAYRGGRVARDTALGVLLDFARTHPDFPAVGTFYVLREPFGGVSQGVAMLRWLAANGFELGNHTYDHVPLNTLSSSDVQRELVEGAKVITTAVPGYRIRTMALPLGALPRPARLAVQGSSGGVRYGPYGVMLVGANPAPSPFSSGFDPAAVPRIRSSHLPWGTSVDFTAAYWLRELERHPDSRYVSDGDPRRITFPRRLRSTLDARYRTRAHPY